MLRVQELWVDPAGRHKIFTDYKNFSRLVTRGLGFGGPDLLEELLENPVEREVVLGAEHFGNEPASLSQELCCQLQGVKCQFRCWEEQFNVSIVLVYPTTIYCYIRQLFIDYHRNCHQLQGMKSQLHSWEDQFNVNIILIYSTIIFCVVIQLFTDYHRDCCQIQGAAKKKKKASC